MEKLKELKELIMWQAEIVKENVDKYVSATEYDEIPHMSELKEAAEATEKLTQVYISILGVEECHRADVLYKKIDELSSELAKYKKEEIGCLNLNLQTPKSGC